MLRVLVIAVLLCLLLFPGAAAAWPVECWLAAETGKWSDWLWCGAVVVFMQMTEPGENGYYPGP